MTGGTIARGDFNLTDDSACACSANHKIRFGLIAIARMRNSFEQCASNTAKPTLSIPNRLSGTPRDGTRRDRVRDASLPRHARATPATCAKDEIRVRQCIEQRRDVRWIMLIVRIHGDDGVDPWREREHRIKAGHQRTSLASINWV
jgi:hypothetical protein